MKKQNQEKFRYKKKLIRIRGSYLVLIPHWVIEKWEKVSPNFTDIILETLGEDVLIKLFKEGK